MPEHDPENACPGLDPGWTPVSRLREALACSHRVDQCFGGRRQVGKDHAPRTSYGAMTNPVARVAGTTAA
jgi:hypothetical protein